MIVIFFGKKTRVYFFGMFFMLITSESALANQCEDDLFTASRNSGRGQQYLRVAKADHKWVVDNYKTAPKSELCTKLLNVRVALRQGRPHISRAFNFYGYAWNSCGKNKQKFALSNRNLMKQYGAQARSLASVADENITNFKCLD
jgi:hypothetical protein